MTVYKFATIPKWVARQKKVHTAVYKKAVNDLMKEIEVVPGINKGGERIHGTIPRDLGTLASSLTSSLRGSTALTREGEESYILVINSLQAGDTVKFSWGGAASEYAARIHYGFTDTDSQGRTYNQPGTFWIDAAAAKWQEYVNKAVRAVRAEING